MSTYDLLHMPSAVEQVSADPDLTERLTLVRPEQPLRVVPGHLVLLLPLHLPLKSARKRRIAARFAMEEHLCMPIEDMVVSVGAQLGENRWLCAATQREVVEDLPGEGPILPDLSAVPLPQHSGHWSVWLGAEAAYLRFEDGGGISVATNAFVPLWQAFGRPAVELYHGLAPPGLEVQHHAQVLPDLTAEILALDLSTEAPFAAKPWISTAKVMAVAGSIALAGHGALMKLDAHALSQIASERQYALEVRLASSGLPIDVSLPEDVLLRTIQTASVTGTAADPFLVALANLSSVVAPIGGIRLRDLKYDSETETITLIALAPELSTLQRAGRDLEAAGLAVRMGAAVQGAAGAELQMVLTGAI